jgi:hypothetical protein
MRQFPIRNRFDTQMMRHVIFCCVFLRFFAPEMAENSQKRRKTWRFLEIFGTVQAILHPVSGASEAAQTHTQAF